MKMMMKKYFVCAALIVATQCYSQSLPDNYGFKQFDNGLQVLVIENPGFPLVNIELAVKSGSAYETKEESGLAFLNQFLFFKANKDYISADAMSAQMKKLGIVNGQNMEEEYSSFFITLSKANYENGLRLMNSSARSPLYLPEDVDDAIAKVNEQYQQFKIDPVYFLDDKLKLQLWGDNYHRKNLLGDYSIIQQANYELLQHYHDQFYLPNNCLLIVSGSVNRAEVFAKVEAIFGDWKKGDNPFAQSGFPVEQPLPLSSQFVVESPLVQMPAFLFTYFGPDYSTNKNLSYAAEVFATMLSLPASSYNQSLVGESAAVQADVIFNKARYGSSVNFLLLCDPTRLKETYLRFQDQIMKWSQPSALSSDLVEAAKKRITGDYAFHNEKFSNFTHNIAKGWATMGITDYLYFTNHINDVSADDVLSFINQYLVGKPHLAGLLISPADRQNQSTDDFFTDTYNINEYLFLFEHNAADLLGGASEKRFQSFIQYLKLNPLIELELDANQELNERKETAMDRFLTMYKAMKAAGVLQAQLDAMKVSLFLQDGPPTGDLKNNQYVSFKMLSTNYLLSDEK